MNILKPSVFTAQPMGSVTQNSESETVARNIMVIRKRLGDAWPLTWQQYKAEREKDGGNGCADSEREFFREVIELIPDAVGAIRFADAWARAARKALAAGPVEIEVCERLMDRGHAPIIKGDHVVGSKDTPKFHAQIKDAGGYWGAGDSTAEALGSMMLSHQERFGITVAILGKLPR